MNNWERIESVIRWANMTTNYFARYIGLPRGENLYQIKKGNNGISRDVASRIVAKFPQIDKLWLLTGDGQMFSDQKVRGVQIPFYNVGVEQSITMLSKLEPESYMIVPQVGDCDLAMIYTGQARGQSLPSGTVVLLKHDEVARLKPGCEYVIITKNLVTLRKLRTITEAGDAELVAGYRTRFGNITVKIDEITDVYRVKGLVTLNE